MKMKSFAIGLMALTVGCATAPQCLSGRYDGAALRAAPKHVIVVGWDGFAGTNYDTGATIAALLGLDPPACWIGRPFDEAFDAK